MKTATVGTRWLALAVLLGAWTAACDDEGSPPPVEDPCGNRCLTELGELCNEATGTCYFPDAGGGDAGDTGGDAPPDVPDQGDEPDEGGGCLGDDECPGSQYCAANGGCTPGCRAGDADNCDDCSLFPQTCQSGLSCHPIDHECVGGCVADGDCPADQFCNLDNGLCQSGCRASPDNCANITGNPTYVCDEGSHVCIGGPCDDDDGCDAGAFCDVGQDSLCVWGCRTAPDNCGGGQACNPDSHSCGPRACDCDDLTGEACDALCDNATGGTSAYYCNAENQVCEIGCRIRDDGTDTCRPGTVCDDDARICEEGCAIDETCPFFTWCDDGDCAPGCKPGECEEPDFCDLESRTCLSQPCDGDSDCPDGTYCGTGDVCLDGCRLDDPGTAGVDEETCAGELVCDPVTRGCRVAGCEEHADCPLGEYCSVQGACIPGCSGMDDRCPVGEPCSAVNGFCGCTRDADCDADQHCVAPVCTIDCIPDDPAIVGRQDTCPIGLTCDPESGRCVGGCLDNNESTTRNDTPDTATCAMFLESDLFDGQQVDLCRAGETHLPPASFCEGAEGSFCTNSVACTGGDFDWYTMYLYAGDQISFAAHYGQPASTTFVLELVSADNPSLRLRGATATASGVGTVTPFVVTQSNQYLLRAFAVEDDPVPYELELQVSRVLTCREDLYEPNNNPNVFAPEIENTDIPQDFPGLAMCEGDRDFFAIDLFAGNLFTAIVDPDQAAAALQLNLGTPNDGGTDLDPVTGAGSVNIAATPYADPEDEGDPNDLIIDGVPVPRTDRFYVRVRSLDPESEAFYGMSVLTERGSATCANTVYEPNDDADPDGFLAAAEYRVRDVPIPGGVTFEGARVCPADGGAGDVDYYMVTVHADVAGGLLTASVIEDGLDSNRLTVSLFRWNGSGLDPVGDEDPNQLSDVELGEGIYFVRVRQNPFEEVGWQGVVYDLDLGYSMFECGDDALEPNNAPGAARRLDPSVLLGDGECSFGRLGACDDDTPGNPPYCLCHDRPGLTMCPGDQDWYLLRLLVGDSFSVEIDPTSVNANDLSAFLWPRTADCTPGDFGDCPELVPFSASGGTLRVINQTVLPQSVGVIAEYYVSVENFTGEPIDYQIHSEVLGEGSRNCPADSWDADFEDYPNENEVACNSSSCTMSLDPNNRTRTGNICYWDQQDVFRFTLNASTDLQVLVEYFVDEGRIDGELSGGALGGAVDLEERDGAHGNPEGIEWVFPDLAAGTYQIELFMPGRGTGIFGSSPNDYTVTLDTQICSDGLWSMNEECDPTSPASDATMCGAGSSCQGNCTCD